MWATSGEVEDQRPQPLNRALGPHGKGRREGGVFLSEKVEKGDGGGIGGAAQQTGLWTGLQPGLLVQCALLCACVRHRNVRLASSCTCSLVR